MKRTQKFISSVEMHMLDCVYQLEGWKPGDLQKPPLRSRGKIGDDEGPEVQAFVKKIASYHGIDAEHVVIFPNGEIVIEDEAELVAAGAPAPKAPKKKRSK